VLEVRDGIDTRGVRDLPGALGQLGDRRQRARIEDVARVRMDDDQNVVAL